MRHEIKEPAKGLLHNNDNQAHAIPSVRPLLNGLRSHSRDATKDGSVLLTEASKFHRHRKGYTDIPYIRKDSLRVLGPFFICALSQACTKSHFDGVETQLSSLCLLTP